MKSDNIKREAADKDKSEAKRRAKLEAERQKRRLELEAAARKKEKLLLRERQRAERKRLKAEREKAAAARFEEREKLRAEKLRLRKAFYSRVRKKLNNPSAGFSGDIGGIVPRVELEAEGDGMSVVSRFAVAGVGIADVRTEGGKTRFKIRKKDLRKGIAILDEMCYNYKISATYGIGRGFFFMLSRSGLLVGAALSVVALNIAYGYIWRVDISGNESLSAAYIQSVLGEAGFGAGLKKRAVSTDAVVAALGLTDGVADASCEVVGTTMYVRVLEAKEHVTRREFGYFVSDYDALVTRTVVRSGSAVVSRGDVVKKGDTLVCGDVYGTAGEVLYTVPCDADVYGEISVALAADISNIRVEYVPTGRTAVKTEYALFGYTLGKVKPPYGSYSVKAHTSRYDVLLPLYATTYEFTETAAREVEIDIDEAVAEYIAQKRDELKFLGEFESSYTIAPTVGGLYSVHLFLRGEALISKGVPQPL